MIQNFILLHLKVYIVTHHLKFLNNVITNTLFDQSVKKVNY
jgi:hypothetical protein